MVFLHISLVGDKSICPIAALQQFIRLRSSVSGYLFIHGNRLPVTRYQFGAILNKVISYACLSNKFFKNHSLRIGRATELAMASVPSDQVITMGRWQSGCCTKYIRP